MLIKGNKLAGSILLVVLAFTAGVCSVRGAGGQVYSVDSKTVQTQDDLDYYFGSDSSDFLRPDNRITVTFDNNGDASVLVRLHVKSHSPSGVGDSIDIPVPYPSDRVLVTETSVSGQRDTTYQVKGVGGQTLIRIELEGSPKETYVETLYTVKRLSDLSKYNISFILSRFTTELSINLMISNKETWLTRKSVDLSPSASGDTYFLINEEALPFAVFLVLANVNSGIIELSVGTQSAPYSLELMPYYALVISVSPSVLLLIATWVLSALTRRRRVGMVVLAYRNLHRRVGRFILTILGVGIPSMLLVQMLVQSTLAQKMIGSQAEGGGWYVALILIISIVIGGFQVFNTVYSSVLERMRELGVMKAIGFTPFHIFKMVISESVIIGLVAGFFGSALAGVLAAVSAQVFYGLSIPNTEFSEIVARTFGGMDLNNPFLRNSSIAMFSSMIMNMIFAYLWPPEYETNSTFAMMTSFLLFLILVRPTDPFTVDRLVELAPILAANMGFGVLFATILSVLAGSYVAYKAGRIEPSEAMRHV